LRGGVPPGDLVDRVLAYHCGHLRQLTSSHRRDAPTDDYHTARWTTQPDLPAQRDTWGLVGADIEEISLVRSPARAYLDVLQKIRDSEGEQCLLKAATYFDYDEQHVLPFLLSEFVHASRSLAVAWFGREPGMLERFLAGWRGMGFTGPVLIPHEFFGALHGDGLPGVESVRLVAACDRADAAIVDFARRMDLGVADYEWRYYRLRHALAEFCNRERERIRRTGMLPRRVITIGAIANDFERLVDSFLDAPLTPFCTRVRQGVVLYPTAAECGSSQMAPPARKNILVIVPTRSRPEQSDRFADAFLTHSTRCDLLFVLDEDDPLLSDYPRIDGAYYEVHPGSAPLDALNRAATTHKEWYDYLAYMGDDHRVRTSDWDRLLVEAIADLPLGVAYGDDRRGMEHPSFILMSSSIVRELGYLVPPVLRRYQMGRFWRDVGEGLCSLRYRDDVVVERLRSSETRATASRGNISRDATAHDDNRGAQFHEDAATLRRALDAYLGPTTSV
jgi:hypothetical protein